MVFFARLMHFVSRFLAAVSAVRCLGCGRYGQSFCRACRKILAGGGVVERRVFKGDGFGSVASLAVYSVFDYAGVPRRALLALKHHDTPRIARFFAPVVRQLLATCLASADYRDCVLVPIPSRRSRVRQRGFNHLLLLLAKARVSKAFVWRVLTASGARTSQVGLDFKMRAANAARLQLDRGCLQRLLHKNSRPRVVLFDDVCTTGASLLAAANLLNAAGCDVLAAVTIFRVPLLQAHAV